MRGPVLAILSLCCVAVGQPAAVAQPASKPRFASESESAAVAGAGAGAVGAQRAATAASGASAEQWRWPGWGWWWGRRRLENARAQLRAAEHQRAVLGDELTHARAAAAAAKREQMVRFLVPRRRGGARVGGSGR